MTTTQTRLSAGKRDIIVAMALGGIVLRRSGKAPTLHCPETGRTISNLLARQIIQLLSDGLVEGSTLTKRGRFNGILRLTSDGQSLADECLGVVR